MGENDETKRICNLVHIEGEECSAKGKRYYKCKGQGHYARSPACPQSKSTTRKVTEKTTNLDTDNSNSVKEVGRVESSI